MKADSLQTGMQGDRCAIRGHADQAPFGRFKRPLFLFAGFLSVALGMLGIVLPLLPTTPFMLLGVFCFARSSARWHRWLLTHPIYGGYITAFSEKRGLTKTQKQHIAITSTIMLSITAFFGPAPLAIWIAGTIWSILMAFLLLSRSAASTPI